MDHNELSNEQLLRHSATVSTLIGELRSTLIAQPGQSISPLTTLEQVMHLRLLFRQLADGIESNRELAQLQRQRIQKSKIYFQGLRFYKEFFSNKIADCEQEALDMSKHLTDTDFKGWQNSHSQHQVRQQLELVRQKQLAYDKLLTKKKELQKTYSLRDQSQSEALLLSARKLYDSILQTSKLLTSAETASVQVKNSLLQCVYNCLAPLRVARSGLSLSVAQGQFEELIVTLDPSQNRLYKEALSKNIPVEELKIKFIICALDDYRLAIGVDRRDQYTTEQVFSYLLCGEPTMLIHPNAKTENQRNINSRFARVSWLERDVASGAYGVELMESVRERYFSLQLRKTVAQLCTKRLKEISSGARQDQRISFVGLEAISKEEYLKQVHVPEWVQAYKNDLQIQQHAIGQSPFANNSNIKAARAALEDILESLGLKQLSPNQMRKVNQRFEKGSITTSKFTLTFVIKTPYDYPRNPSEIKIMSFTRKGIVVGNSIQASRVPCKGNIAESEGTLPKLLIDLEDNLNCRTGGLNHFRLVTQMLDLMNWAIKGDAK